MFGNMSDLYCPYCDEWLEICHDDGFGYDEDRAHEMYCSSCHKNFVFHTSISFNYYPEKADCLNGEPHNFSGWYKIYEMNDKIIERRRCRECEFEERRTRINEL